MEYWVQNDHSNIPTPQHFSLTRADYVPMHATRPRLTLAPILLHDGKQIQR
jgi:hypothetical protein